jgi:hypothetical protein
MTTLGLAAAPGPTLVDSYTLPMADGVNYESALQVDRLAFPRADCSAKAEHQEEAPQPDRYCGRAGRKVTTSLSVGASCQRPASAGRDNGEWESRTTMAHRRLRPVASTAKRDEHRPDKHR